MTSSENKQPIYIILLLVLAGESIFVLPFVLARVFRPIFLDVFDLSNEELGYCFSVYGIVALISYFLGGGLADKYQPRHLMSFAMLLTACGGIYMSTFPSYEMMLVLFGFWGFTTIFLFWSPLIKATRVWGANKSQGKAFGMLDGGRGLVAAGFGFMGVYLLSTLYPVNPELLNIENKQEIFRQVILYSSLLIILISIFVLTGLKLPKDIQPTERNPVLYYLACLKLPSVWLLMFIILSAYVGYKITDYFAQYANEIMNYDELLSGKIGTYLLLLRAVVAVMIGFIADRFNPFYLLLGGFGCLLLGALIFSFGGIRPPEYLFFILSVLITGIGVYATRALYYAVMKKGKIPLVYTGTAVGIVSIVGYTPDIFVGPLTGNMLDNHPGMQGYQMIFGTLALFALVGLISSYVFMKINKR
ncbi:MAG: MFS transporter [Crocinitomicaceae bacterium]|nr:MFS transporter [Crocinitomicaceae bacterium]